MKADLKRFVPGPLILLSRVARSVFRQPITPSVKPELPCEAINWLEDRLQGAHYLEYGSGGSTLFALQRCALVFSAESDKRWMNAVLQRSASLRKTAEAHPVVVNIGFTGTWGYPIYTRPTPRRLRKWRTYIDAPWRARDRYAASNHDSTLPNVVLIDGRFRVACAIQSMIETAGANDPDFLIDDFFDREDAYSPIIPFTTQRQRLGRALAFRRAPDFSEPAAAAVRDAYLKDPR